MRIALLLGLVACAAEPIEPSLYQQERECRPYLDCPTCLVDVCCEVIDGVTSCELLAEDDTAWPCSGGDCARMGPDGVTPKLAAEDHCGGTHSVLAPAEAGPNECLWH